MENDDDELEKLAAGLGVESVATVARRVGVSVDEMARRIDEAKSEHHRRVAVPRCDDPRAMRVVDRDGVVMFQRGGIDGKGAGAPSATTPLCRWLAEQRRRYLNSIHEALNGPSWQKKLAARQKRCREGRHDSDIVALAANLLAKGMPTHNVRGAVAARLKLPRRTVDARVTARWNDITKKRAI